MRSRIFRVVALVSDGQVQGRITIETPEGSSSSREVTGTTCSEVIHAMVLIAALAIDPHPRPGSLAIDAPVPSAQPGGDWHAALGVGAGALDGQGLPALYGGRLWIEALSEGSGHWAPALRLSVGRMLSSTVTSPGGEASFTSTTATLDACSLRVPVEGWWWATPCVGITGGALSGRGQNVEKPHDETRPWAALGASLRVRARVLSVLDLELEAGVDAPLVRYRFHLEPDFTVLRVPVAAIFAQAGLGVHFW